MPLTPLDRLEWLAAVAAERSLWGAPVAVAGALAYLASEGKCHPGLALLVQETGLHKATCARVLAKLERAGFVGKQKRQGRGRATEYTLKLSHLEATVSGRRVNGKTVAQTVAQTVAPRCDTEWGSGVKELTTNAPASGNRSEGKRAANAIQSKFPPGCVDAQLAGAMRSNSEEEDRREH